MSLTKSEDWRRAALFDVSRFPLIFSLRVGFAYSSHLSEIGFQLSNKHVQVGDIPYFFKFMAMRHAMGLHKRVISKWRRHWKIFISSRTVLTSSVPEEWFVWPGPQTLSQSYLREMSIRTQYHVVVVAIAIETALLYISRNIRIVQLKPPCVVVLCLPRVCLK